ncbi:MAG TPA: 30S ribosomal protein S17 [Planctomycetota bacterium]|nr:30S ribosomal protein S17 [Planctomycetota bacterium]
MSTNIPESNAAAAGTKQRAQRKIMRGIVISTKMQKTLVVQVDRKVRHPVYEKFVSRRTKLYAHDEKGEAKVGDVVDVAHTRPLSKMKCWRLVRVVQQAKIL